MEYVKWYWYHKFSDEPYLFFAELGADRWAIRTVEVFKDRHQFYAQEGEEYGTFMPEAAYPPNEEINSMGEFKILNIPKDEFIKVWNRRKQNYIGNL